MQKENPALSKSFEFAKNIVFLYKNIVLEHKEYTLSKQLLRAGTSIGANISEANGAISEADFSNKISIAYKECLETKYWLLLLKETNYISESTFKEIHEYADELAKILFSILKKTRIKQKE
jgi:four helix bundle protein